MSEIERLAEIVRDTASWSSEGAGQVENPIEIVRAVLTAMRAPRDRALTECSNLPNPEYGRLFTLPKNGRAYWQAMVDHLLSDHPAEGDEGG